MMGSRVHVARGLLIASVCWSILTAAVAWRAQDQAPAVDVDASSGAQPLPASQVLTATNPPTPNYERFLPPGLTLTQLPDGKQTAIVREAKARAGMPDPTFTPT